MLQKSYDNKNSLYLIPTPIGNFEDITIRALNLLRDVDYILCEDTRVTRGLLNHFEIKNKLVSCHEHNEDSIKEKVLMDLQKGLNIGLVTDQGSPIISDPGYKVVKYLSENGANVIALPGATAFVPAIMTSGINSDNFLFYGFLNAKQSKRRKELEILCKEKYTLVIYESVHRIKDCLNDMYEVLGNRSVCICRELSKIHEEIIRDTLENIKNLDIVEKGEFVIILEGNKEKKDYSDIDIYNHVKLYLEDGYSEKDAIKLVAKERNLKKSDVYKDYHIRK